MKQDEKKQLFKALLLLPINVVVIIPALILMFSDYQFRLPGTGLLVLGGLFFVIGMVLAVSTVRLFVKIGQGTPAPWSPPKKLITEGPYLYVRNPMISGVCFMLLAEMCWFLSNGIALWFLIFVLANSIYIPFFEEKGLKKRFGESYLEYMSHVPRWIPRSKPWRRD